MPTPFPVVLFDLDGTLVDSRPGILGSLRRMMASLGHEPPEIESLGWVVGPPLDEVVARLLGPLGDDRAELAVRLYREHYGAVGIYDSRPFEGVAEMLKTLAGQGRRLAVATSKQERFALRLLEHAGLLGSFEAVHGSDPPARPGRKDWLIRDAMAGLGASPGSAVMVGDREHDAVGAIANGVAFVGALYGYGGREELEAAGARAFCESPAEVVSLV